MLIFDLRSIGNKLLAIRKRMGMTQAEVAEAAVMSDRTYADIERGSVNMRTETVLFAGARDYYITTESSRKNLGESLWQHFKPAGHIVVRVHPGGKTYEVFVLDIYSGDYRIKYRSGIKNVER